MTALSAIPLRKTNVDKHGQMSLSAGPAYVISERLILGENLSELRQHAFEIRTVGHGQTDNALNKLVSLP